MSQNMISATLTEDDFAATIGDIATISDRLNFLIDLSPKDRQKLPKLGDSSQAFVYKSQEIAHKHREILPGRFDLEEFDRDLTLFRQLNSIRTSLSPLVDKLTDTALAAGSDAYRSALEVYGFTKAAGTGDGLEELRRDIFRRFGRRRRTETGEERE